MTEYEKAKARIEEIEQAWKELEEEYSELRTIVEEYETQLTDSSGLARCLGEP